ncbi:MAG: NUDIX domain-containing protein [Anaerolineales bacterium]|nr:NUDIX domain-containing protein [Anaerolineales bacterium]
MYIHILYFCYRVFCFIFRPVRMGVRVMMIQDNHVTLVRQTYLRGWFMPGGGLKRGETLEQAARREAFEETGAELGELTLLGAYTNFAEWRTDHNLVFVCHDFKIIGKPDKEIAELKSFPLKALPPDLWPGHVRRLEEYQAGKASPQFGEW